MLLLLVKLISLISSLDGFIKGIEFFIFNVFTIMALIGFVNYKELGDRYIFMIGIFHALNMILLRVFLGSFDIFSLFIIVFLLIYTKPSIKKISKQKRMILRDLSLREPVIEEEDEIVDDYDSEEDSEEESIEDLEEDEMVEEEEEIVDDIQKEIEIINQLIADKKAATNISEAKKEVKKSKKTKNIKSAVMSATAKNKISKVVDVPGRYVASKKSNMFHTPKCEWSKRIKDDRMVWFKDRKVAEQDGLIAHNCVELE